MSCFYLAKDLCDDITSMIVRFWWAQQDQDHKIRWLGKENLLKSKKNGGMGFRDLYGFNLAMLSRQGWRVLQLPKSICAQILRAKYYPDGDLLNAKPKKFMSYSWRSILKGLQLLKKGIIWRVGDGLNINIWDDPWLPRKNSRYVETRRNDMVLTKVNELIDPISGQWNETLVDGIFCPEDAQCIKCIPICGNTEDFIAWHYDLDMMQQQHNDL